MRTRDIVAKLGEQRDVMSKWRNRFVLKGIAGLYDALRGEKINSIRLQVAKRAVLDKVEEKPTQSRTGWNGSGLSYGKNGS